MEEKHGGLMRLDNDSESFKEKNESLHLIDMEFRDGIFTWSNRRPRYHQIACKFYRFLISEPLMLDDLLMDSIIFPTYGSDH